MVFHCKFCGININGQKRLEAHLKTNKHLKNVLLYENENIGDKENLKEDDDNNTNNNDVKERSNSSLEDLLVNNDVKETSHLSLEYLLNEIGRMKKSLSEMNEIKEELRKQKKRITELETQIVTQGTGTSVHHTINGDYSTMNVNKYINENQFRVELHVHAFGSEDLSYITDNIMTQLMSQPMSFVNRWVRHVHFNERYPQNMNIKIKNVKDNFYQIYNGDTWRNVDKKKFLEYMVADIFNQAETRNCTDDSSIELWKTLSNRYKPLWVQTIEQATDGEHPNHKAFVKDLKNRLDAEIKTQQKKYDDRRKAVNDKRLRVWHKLPPTIETIEEKYPTKNPYGSIKPLIQDGVI